MSAPSHGPWRGAGGGRAVALAFVSTLAIMYVLPFPVYGTLSALGLVEIPEPDAPGRFMLGVLVVKIGVALGFVLLLRRAFEAFAGRWMLYAAIWWLMFAIVEVGQAIGPGYSAGDAGGGIISEALYFPLSSRVAVRLLGGRAEAD